MAAGRGQAILGSASGDGNNNGGDSVATSGGAVIDPASLVNDGATGNSGDGGSSEPVRRRGRPKGSRNGTGSGKNKENKADLGFLEGWLYTGHLGLAAATGIPELAIDEAEAKQLTDASSELAAYYGVEVSPKTAAWFKFTSALAKVYGSRVITIVVAKKTATEAAETQEPNPNLASPIRVVGG